MVELTPEEEHFYGNSPTSVLYDLAAETATRLGGKYMALADAAATEAECREWQQRMYETEDAREAIGLDDRDALIAYIVRGRSEIDRLRSEGRS